MENIFLNFVQANGILGLMLAGLIWYLQKLNAIQSEQFKRLFESAMAQIENLKNENKENKATEIQFRSYLISVAKEHHDIIKNNTEAYSQFVLMIERYLRTKRP